jgi:hypothetical protein
MTPLQRGAFGPQEVGQPVTPVRVARFDCEIEEESQRLTGTKLDRISRGRPEFRSA